MKLMRNKRSGVLAVYDPVVIAEGRWEAYEPPKEPEQTDEDDFVLEDTLTISLRGSSGAMASTKVTR